MKETSKDYRKAKHGSLGEKASKKLTYDEKKDYDYDIELMTDKYAFEKYCSGCDLFETEECPNFGKVNFDTEWKKINCKNFLD